MITWAAYVDIYNGARNTTRNADFARASILFDIYTTKPWTKLENFISFSLYTEISKLSWSQILKNHLNEKTTYANNTIKLMQKFGSAAYEKFGREALLVANKLKAHEAKKLIISYKRYVKESPDYTYIPARTARNIALSEGFLSTSTKVDKLNILLQNLSKLHGTKNYKSACYLLNAYINNITVNSFITKI